MLIFRLFPQFNAIIRRARRNNTEFIELADDSDRHPEYLGIYCETTLSTR
ncbi:Uncharacterised protein [Mycobacteroides abscessus subsp. bolletii]|nr:Uncharacterised protein [Mycobacteroides abscessus subsp. bolletii]